MTRKMSSSGKTPKFWFDVMDSQKHNPEKLGLTKVKTVEELFEKSVKFLLNHKASLTFNCPNKDNDKSTEYRNNSNKLLSSKEGNVKIAEMYTKSIAYALPATMELSLAYANRSAVLLKAQQYEQCLLDIEKALQNRYPENLKAKLYARRVQCVESCWTHFNIMVQLIELTCKYGLPPFQEALMFQEQLKNWYASTSAD